MLPLRLKSEPSVTVLVLDVFVFGVTLQGALDADAPGWIRTACGVIALTAAVLGVRSAALLYAHQTRLQ